MPIAITRTKPFINVTPLIDVLLVMLIIFMVAVPLRPQSLAARLPSQQQTIADVINDRTLVVTIGPDHKLKLNSLPNDMGTIEDSSRLKVFLVALFRERQINHLYREDMLTRLDVAGQHRIEKTVFIKAPRPLAYGRVVSVMDSVKGSGADPVGLQLDDLK